jgi:hypothetical protein
VPWYYQYIVAFQIQHIPSHEDLKANMLAQQASGYDVSGRNFHVWEKPMHKNFSFSRAGADQSAKPTVLVGSTDSLSAEAQSATPTPSSRLSRLPQSA